MDNNFLTFIDEDIEAKKTLFSTMPVNTKRDIKKFNEKIDSIYKKYKNYKASVKKYLDTKSKSFNIKNPDKKLDKIKEEIKEYQYINVILNPMNTYYEKLGFDSLIFELSNYYDFNLSSLIDIINKLLDKFEEADIVLSKDDFDYTCYVNEYMSCFYEARNNKDKDYDKVSEVFESIYWANPDIISHIELNFRKLIKKFEKEFNNYINKIKREIIKNKKIEDINEAREKLKELYVELNKAGKENISDIITKAKEGEIDMNNYFEESKIRISAYTTLIINATNLDDKEFMDKFYENLEKLRINIEEFNNYNKFLPLIDDFKEKYQNLVSNNENTTKKELKNIESKIANKESKLNKINKRIKGNTFGFLGIKSNETLKKLKLESIKQAKELYELYKTYDQEYFNDKVMSILSNSLTLFELLNLYYSFSYYKKNAIRNVFSLINYDDIINYSNEFDLFATNLSIINDFGVFEEYNIAKIIMNKYRLDNINLNEESLNDLGTLFEKINLILRIKTIENSETTIEKIWFMAQVEKINYMENQKEQETS